MQNKQQNKSDAVKIALFIAGGFLLFRLTKKLVGFIEDPIGTAQASENFEGQITVDPTKLTYPEWQYTSWANSLEQTLLIDSTENESLIDSIIFKMQNDNDWNKLVKNFGIRVNYVLGYIPTGSFTLPAALLEFTPERIQDYNNHFAGWNMQSRI